MSAPSRGGGAIFVLPTTTVGQMGPVAGWISTCGWATAAERELGRAWIVTRHGILDVEEVRRRAAASDLSAAGAEHRVRRAVPPLLKTLVKDAREARRARGFRVDPRGPWTDAECEVEFVWQRHELFHRAGIDLADEMRVPSVLFVPALVVWQAEQWAVRRPGWGRWLEAHTEAPALRGATLVACGSDVVADQAARLGVSEDRILVTPTGVDVGPSPRARSIVPPPGTSSGSTAELVVGWTGSFRPFHQLELLVRAVADVAGASLLLVGDGPERSNIERLAAQLGVHARFTGLVPHGELPRMLAAMDVGVVLARSDASFHYSPLKVAEYLAAGLPVVAPDAGQLSEQLDRELNAAFFTPGDVDDLASVLRAVGADPARRARLAAGARESATAWSWDRQVQRVRRALCTI